MLLLPISTSDALPLKFGFVRYQGVIKIATRTYTQKVASFLMYKRMNSEVVPLGSPHLEF